MHPGKCDGEVGHLETPTGTDKQPQGKHTLLSRRRGNGQPHKKTYRYKQFHSNQRGRGVRTWTTAHGTKSPLSLNVTEASQWAGAVHLCLLQPKKCQWRGAVAPSTSQCKKCPSPWPRPPELMKPTQPPPKAIEEGLLTEYLSKIHTLMIQWVLNLNIQTRK